MADDREGRPLDKKTANNDEPAEGYRPVSAAAAAALFLGLLSPLTLEYPLFVILPFLAAALALLALLRSFRRSPHLLGRKAALAGLLLASASVAAAISQQFVLEGALDREAAATGLQWFTLLADNHPEKAYQLTLLPDERQPLDDDRALRAFYGKAPHLQAALDRYVQFDAVRTLLALGPKAAVRYERLRSESALGSSAALELEFVVTFDEAGAKKTLRIALPMQRIVRHDGKAEWQIYRPRTGSELDEE